MPLIDLVPLIRLHLLSQSRPCLQLYFLIFLEKICRDPIDSDPHPSSSHSPFTTEDISVEFKHFVYVQAMQLHQRNFIDDEELEKIMDRLADPSGTNADLQAMIQAYVVQLWLILTYSSSTSFDLFDSSSRLASMFFPSAPARCPGSTVKHRAC